MNERFAQIEWEISSLQAQIDIMELNLEFGDDVDIDNLIDLKYRLKMLEHERSEILCLK